MEFLPNYSGPTPKILFPCLASITVTPHLTADRSRRLSGASFGSNDGGEEKDNALKRVISGGRRKSFGTGTGAAAPSAEERRASIVAGMLGETPAQPAQSQAQAHGHSAATQGTHQASSEKGTWYWRVQAGVTDGHLVLLPLSQPPNPILTRAPAPLSEAMPSHSTSHKSHGDSHTHGAAGEDEGLVDKMKNLFRRGSAATNTSTATGASDSTAVPSGAAPNKDGKVDVITDHAEHAEKGWPGTLHDGQRLGAVVVPLGGVDNRKVVLGGGGKREGSSVTVPIISHFGGMTHGWTDNSSGGPKSGSIKLEFDKDWIGGKAEAEILHTQLTTQAERTPAPTSFQLPSHSANTHAAGNTGSHPNPGMGEVESARGPRVQYVPPIDHPNPGMAEVALGRRASMGRGLVHPGQAQGPGQGQAVPIDHLNVRDENGGSGRKVAGVL